MSIGGNIAKLRKQKNLTQEDLAAVIGISRSFIAQFERGTKAPTVPVAKAIAEVLGCTLDALADDSDIVAG